MTKEQLIAAMEAIINNKPADLAAQLIWVLWMDHASYKVDGNKVVKKETGEEIKL